MWQYTIEVAVIVFVFLFGYPTWAWVSSPLLFGGQLREDLAQPEGSPVFPG